MTDQVSVKWPERAGDPVVLAIIGASVSLPSMEAWMVSDEIREAAMIGLGQEREAIRPAAEGGAPAGVITEKPSASTGANSPEWKALGGHLRLEWRDDQGRRCIRFAATFHEQAGSDTGWSAEVAWAVAELLNEHKYLPSAPAGGPT